MITSAELGRLIASIMRSTSSAARKPRAKAPRPHHRQSECEKRRGARIDSHGFLIKGKNMFRYARLAASSPPPTFRIATAVSRCSTLFGLFPFLGKLFADSAYQGPVFHRALAGILPDLARWRSGEGLRRPAQALGGRTHHRLAQPLPPTGQGRTSTATRCAVLDRRPGLRTFLKKRRQSLLRLVRRPTLGDPLHRVLDECFIDGLRRHVRYELLGLR